MTARVLLVVCCLTTFLHGIKGQTGSNFVVIGDWGNDNVPQYTVAQAMSDWCATAPCQFIIGTGDNFYPDGVVSPDSARFNTTWKHVYNLPNIDTFVWYQSLGNHDYGDYSFDNREYAQVLYGYREPQWYMTYLWYDFHMIGNDGVDVHFIIIDTESIKDQKHDWQGQLTWIEDVLANSTADWKMLAGHSPPYSVGGHAPGADSVRDYIVPLCNEYQVDILWNGHEHNLEHLTSANHTEFVISGAGGKDLYAYNPSGAATVNGYGVNVDYFGHYYGFVSMDITKTSYTAQFIDASDLSVQYSFTRTKQ